jgi:adenylate cyclase
MAQTPSAMQARRRRNSLLLALTAGFLAVALPDLIGGDTLRRLEYKTLDARFVLRGPRPTSGQVAIVDVDDASLAVFGSWPWPRARMAELVDLLTRAGARAIALDIFIAEPDNSPGGPASDARLARAMRESGRVYLAVASARSASRGAEAPSGGPEQRSATPAQLRPFALSGATITHGGGLDASAALFHFSGAIAPTPLFAAAARGVGFVDVTDAGASGASDGVYRWVPLVLQARDALYPSLGLALAQQALDVPSDQLRIHLGKSVQVGPRHIPVDRAGAMAIDFAGDDHAFDYHSFLKVLRESDAYRKEHFAGKTVLVGVTATGLYDLRASPYGAVFNGVETLANALDNILAGRFLRLQKPEIALLYTLCWALLIGFWVPRMSAVVYVPLGAGLIVLHNVMAYLQFAARGVAVEVVTPTLGIGMSLVAVAAYWLITQERRQRALHTTLSRFVPPEIADHLAQEEVLPAHSGERRVVTVIFVDLRGFTAASARMGPEDLVSLLNLYFHEMHQVIVQFGGTLDKFVGDGVMAFFNAPSQQIDHAALAVATALQMQRRIEANREQWAFHGMPDLSAGIGVSTGEVVVGYVGSGERVQYTAVGQEVNLASRLVELAKERGIPVVISQSTYDLVKDIAECRPLGEFALHNVPEPVPVYEVVRM